MADKNLRYVLDLDSSSGVASIKRFTDSTKEGLRESKNEALTLREAIETIGLVEAGKKAVEFGKGLIEAFNESSKETAKLDAVIRATGQAAGLSREEFSAMAEEMSMLTGIDDDVISSMNSVIATFRNVKGDTFKEASKAAMDMSAVMGTDLKSSAVQVGKALQDPIEGLNALRRVGVTFTQDQKDVIEKLMTTGDVAGAQAVILRELEMEFGGAAEAMGQTFGGQVNAVMIQLGNLREAEGAVVSAGLLPLVQEMKNYFGDSQRMSEATAKATAIMEALTVAGVVSAKTINTLYTVFQLVTNDVIMLGSALETGLIAPLYLAAKAASVTLSGLAALPLATDGMKDAAKNITGFAATLKSEMDTAANTTVNAAKGFMDIGDSAVAANKLIEDSGEKMYLGAAGASAEAERQKQISAMETLKKGEKWTDALFEKKKEFFVKLYLEEVKAGENSEAAAARLDSHLSSMGRNRAVAALGYETDKLAKQKKLKEDYDKWLQEFEDRHLKAILTQTDYELSVLKKKYDADMAMAGKNEELKAQAKETYLAAKSKLEEAEDKKRRDAADKALKEVESFSNLAVEIENKGFSASIKNMEVKLKEQVKNNKLSLNDYNLWLNSVTKLYGDASTAAIEKERIKLQTIQVNLKKSKADGLITESDYNQKILQLTADFENMKSSIQVQSADETIARIKEMDDVINASARQWKEFWQTFQFDSNTMQKMSETAWTGIRDHIKQSIKDSKFDIQSLGDMFKSVILDMVATAAANALTLQIASSFGLIQGGGGAGLVSMMMGSAQSPSGGGGAGGAGANIVGTAGQGALMYGAGSGGGVISGTAFAPGGWMGSAMQGPTLSGATAGQGVFYTPGGGVGSGTMMGAGIAGTVGAYGGRYIAGQAGGNREMTNAGGVAGGAAAGFVVGGAWGALIGAIAGLLMSNYGPGSGGPQGYDKNTFGGIGDIRNHPHDALATDSQMLGSTIQAGNAVGASLILKQMEELNTATSLTADAFFHTDAVGIQMRLGWEAITSAGDALSHTITATGLHSEETKTQMAALGTQAADYAIHAAMAGQASSELTTAAVNVAIAMNQEAANTRNSINEFDKMITALGQVDSRMSGLAATSDALRLAQTLLTNANMLDVSTIQAAASAGQELTTIQTRQREILLQLGDANHMTADAVQALKDEYAGLNAQATGIENHLGNLSPSMDPATASTDNLNTSLDGTATSAAAATGKLDPLAVSSKKVGDQGLYAATGVKALYDQLNNLPGNVTLVLDYQQQARIRGSHAAGLDYVPYDGYVAELHKGERVQTAIEADMWRSITNSPVSSFPSFSSGGGGATQHITVNLSLTASPGQDVHAFVDEGMDLIVARLKELSANGRTVVYSPGVGKVMA